MLPEGTAFGFGVRIDFLERHFAERGHSQPRKRYTDFIAEELK